MRLIRLVVYALAGAALLPLAREMKHLQMQSSRVRLLEDGRRHGRSSWNSGERPELAARWKRHEEARPSLVLAVCGVVTVLGVGASLERRYSAHEEQEQGDEHGPITTA